MTDTSRCVCPCHTKADIICSCFVPCCHEPYKAEAEQTERTSIPRQSIQFTRLTFPQIRKHAPKDPDHG